MPSIDPEKVIDLAKATLTRLKASGHTEGIKAYQIRAALIAESDERNIANPELVAKTLDILFEIYLRTTSPGSLEI